MTHCRFKQALKYLGELPFVTMDFQDLNQYNSPLKHHRQSRFVVFIDAKALQSGSLAPGACIIYRALQEGLTFGQNSFSGEGSVFQT